MSEPPANTHTLRTTFVPFEEAFSFDNEIVAYWSQLASRNVTSPLFHLPLRMGGLGVGSAVHRHAAAPWTAWQTVIPTLMAATHLTDTDSLLAATPILRGQMLQLQSTLAPWTAWHSIIPTLMEATESPDIDSQFATTPNLRSQLHQLQTTLSQQMNAPSPPPQIIGRGTPNARVPKGSCQHDPTNDTPTTTIKPFN